MNEDIIEVKLSEEQFSKVVRDYLEKYPTLKEKLNYDPTEGKDMSDLVGEIFLVDGFRFVKEQETAE